MTPLTLSEMGFGVHKKHNREHFQLGMALGAPGVEVTARLTRVALLHNSWLPDGRWDSNCTFAELPNGTLELSTYLSLSPTTA